MNITKCSNCPYCQKEYLEGADILVRMRCGKDRAIHLGAVRVNESKIFNNFIRT